jgi:hypothetical protein
MFKAIALLFAMCLMLLTGCSIFSSGGTETGFGGVEGTIVDSRGKGVRGANITVTIPGDPTIQGESQTDYRGYFKVDKIGARRDLTIKFMKNFPSATIRMEKKNVRVGGGAVTDLGEIELKAGK